MTFWIIQFRSAIIYEKDLDGGQDIRMSTIGTKVFGLEAFGGSIYYQRTSFFNHAIVNIGTGNFVFSMIGAFVDITFMHHSLQPGE